MTAAAGAPPAGGPADAGFWRESAGRIKHRRTGTAWTVCLVDGQVGLRRKDGRPAERPTLRACVIWRRLLAWLGLTRLGRYVFTVVAIAGILLTIADDVRPRPRPEADLGPNIAAVVGFYTLLLLGLIAFTDFTLRSTVRAVRELLANRSS